MGAYTTRVAWETLRSIDSATFNNTYQALGAVLAHPSFICKLVNNSTVLVTISIDGVTDIDVAPANSFWLYDETKTDPALAALPKGTQFFVKAAAAGTGSVYLVSQYVVLA